MSEIFERAIDSDFVRGIATVKDDLLIVLDVVPLLTQRAPGETLQ